MNTVRLTLALALVCTLTGCGDNPTGDRGVPPTGLDPETCADLTGANDLDFLRVTSTGVRTDSLGWPRCECRFTYDPGYTCVWAEDPRDGSGSEGSGFEGSGV